MHTTIFFKKSYNNTQGILLVRTNAFRCLNKYGLNKSSIIRPVEIFLVTIISEATKQVL